MVSIRSKSSAHLAKPSDDLAKSSAHLAKSSDDLGKMGEYVSTQTLVKQIIDSFS